MTSWEEYERHLQMHDWYFQLTNDQERIENGTKSVKRLLGETKDLLIVDRQKTMNLFRLYCPYDHVSDYFFDQLT